MRPLTFFFLKVSYIRSVCVYTNMHTDNSLPPFLSISFFLFPPFSMKIPNGFPFFKRTKQNQESVMPQVNAKTVNIPLLVAGVVGITGIIADHAGEVLKSKFVARRRRAWRTAHSFHLMHSAALATLAWMLLRPGLTDSAASRLTKGFWLVCAGSVGFATSVYAVCFDSVPRWLGVVTPTSGFVLMLGWLWCGAAGLEWNPQ